jgi:hypothetical protein
MGMPSPAPTGDGRGKKKKTNLPRSKKKRVLNGEQGIEKEAEKSNRIHAMRAHPSFR